MEEEDELEVVLPAGDFVSSNEFTGTGKDEGLWKLELPPSEVCLEDDEVVVVTMEEVEDTDGGDETTESGEADEAGRSARSPEDEVFVIAGAGRSFDKMGFCSDSEEGREGEAEEAAAGLDEGLKRSRLVVAEFEAGPPSVAVESSPPPLLLRKE